MDGITNGMAASEIPEVRWRKSAYSNPSGNCVELAALPDGGVAVRNSRHPSGPALIYSRGEMAAFIQGVKNDEFDDLAL
ncbi:hypothetical protein Sme01_11010 [Sphaerisporangium melleum]|uniref:DUF397 domain-containing protein n=1 Tax=Sphaerisporangium melleum TaxID=321316 RepID=A0A917QT79_9ACTN|nr:DUF397 domain-containing protein [Sphaerisporangium melleum]GGK66245.1 hypothetical protein GCM10007964_06610 [Sphaerisporangium melleum]GII68625.1 hypothetical protein Sme01_11010 [Sphaerisporangium melleum]